MNGYLEKFIFIILLNLLNISSFAQGLKLYEINYNQYPEIKARFKAIDSTGNPFFDLNRKDAVVTENNDICKLLYFKAPEKYPRPLSIVLVFDVSGSMKDQRIKIACEAAYSFINQISGINYEIAITTFNNSSFVNTDFTSNKNRLQSIISELYGFGGTSYDSAFFQPKTGIFNIVSNARYNKVVIFMTDGLSKANADSIISVAIKNNIKIYCTSVQLAMPDVLKEISVNTGGNYYEKINDHKQAREIYNDLYEEIVASDFGIVKWQASSICEKNRDVELKIRNLRSTSNYSLVQRVESNFEIKPKSFFIIPAKKNYTITRSFLLKATERQVVIKDIKTDSPDVIKIEKPDSSIVLQENIPVNIKFGCVINDNSKIHARIFIEAENCIENSAIEIFVGERGKIEVVKPEGGEVFAAGSNIDINS